MVEVVALHFASFVLDKRRNKIVRVVEDGLNDLHIAHLPDFWSWSQHFRHLLDAESTKKPDDSLKHYISPGSISSLKSP